MGVNPIQGPRSLRPVIADALRFDISVKRQFAATKAPRFMGSVYRTRYTRGWGGWAPQKRGMEIIAKKNENSCCQRSGFSLIFAEMHCNACFLARG
jgi:hypothetical protein